MTFSALRVYESESGFLQKIEQIPMTDLPDHDVLIKVEFSSLNYKDALSATGNKGITRSFPHTPGIDAAGTVVESRDKNFTNGQKVLVTGYDLGMNTHGGFGEYIRVPGNWIVTIPANVTSEFVMKLGTAGFTAALSLHRLEHNGISPEKGKILVTGATGGVGSLAVALLKKTGYTVVAATRKQNAHKFLYELGADEIISTEEIVSFSDRPLNKALWQGAIDTVGGSVLTGAICSCSMFGAVAACGLTQSAFFKSSVYPFILRGNALLGINSAETPMGLRKTIWQKLSAEWAPALPQTFSQSCGLEETIHKIHDILEGKIVGRILVNPLL
ncbi:MAG: YhdH/YhfP family quinone oxidoreductase [Ignavibacteria bacterium]|nr:YhdH/YhfP family quinone oxidoreductase [Ignavibacteria bacterium]